MWREAMKGQEGGDKRSEQRTTSDNIIGDGCGTSKSCTLSRLEQHHLALFQRVVVEGTLS